MTKQAMLVEAICAIGITNDHLGILAEEMGLASISHTSWVWDTKRLALLGADTLQDIYDGLIVFENHQLTSKEEGRSAWTLSKSR